MTFELEIDTKAQAWLAARPRPDALVIEYDVHRCCGGGKICQVSVRAQSIRDDPNDYARGRCVDGTEVLIDRRAAARLPYRFGLTVSGVGRWKHLDLQLDPDGWGDLLWAWGPKVR